MFGDTLNNVIKWENGEMDSEEEIAFFQYLVDSGLAWSLQGMYGRRAMQLIESGDVTRYR